MYYKHVTIVNYDSSNTSKWSFKLIDDASVVIYNCNVFIIQVSGVFGIDSKLQYKHKSLLHYGINFCRDGTGRRTPIPLPNFDPVPNWT